MRHLKTYESFGMETSKEEMCDYLCKCGYDMMDLQECSLDELRAMCMGEKENETMQEKKEVDSRN